MNEVHTATRQSCVGLQKITAVLEAMALVIFKKRNGLAWISN